MLDQVFAALSDATRREVAERLKHGPATVTELAQPHDMSSDPVDGLAGENLCDLHQRVPASDC